MIFKGTLGMATTAKERLEPLSTGGSLHITRTISHKSNAIRLSTSKNQYITCFLFIAAFIGSLIGALYFLTSDIAAFLALLFAACISGFFAYLIKQGFEQFCFCERTRTVLLSRRDLKTTINFDDIQAIEVIKKIVNAKTHDNPFQSGEVRLLTRTGERYLLTEGANSVELKKIANELARYTGARLLIDNTLHRV